jgi:hypothetical protein
LCDGASLLRDLPADRSGLPYLTIAVLQLPIRPPGSITLAGIKGSMCEIKGVPGIRETLRARRAGATPVVEFDRGTDPPGAADWPAEQVLFARAGLTSVTLENRQLGWFMDGLVDEFAGVA